MFLKKGSYPVLPTAFTEDGIIDFKSIDKLLQKLLKSTVSGLVILGTTSESPTLSIDEKNEIIDFVHKKINGKKYLIIGVGGNDTLKTLEFAKSCHDKADAYMVTVPNYNKPSQDGIFNHFSLIASNNEINDKPIVMYNVPSRCGVNMEPETIKALYDSFPNIVAIKEASGSLDQAIKIKSLCDIQIFSGNDNLVIPIMSIGGAGVITVAGNVYPNLIQKITEYCLKEKYSKASNLYFKLNKFI